MKKWYVIQVFRGYEEKISIEASQDSSYKIFYPKRVKIFKNRSGSYHKNVPLFPGYIFIETEKNYSHFYEFYSKVLNPLEGVIKVLKHKSNAEALWPEEKEFIQSLCNKDNIVETSKGLKVNDKVLITEGPLIGKESQIIKIDRHKRLAYLEFDFLGQKQVIQLSLEVLSKQV